MTQEMDVLPATADMNEPEITQLSVQIGRLMVRYCDAIHACEAIPTLSLMPLLRFYVLYVLWAANIYICLLLVPVDGLLLAGCRLSGRPKIVIGRRFYRFFLAPFRSIWAGEIPVFKLSHVRLLTRLMLYYHAQLRINTLLKRYNRAYLGLLFLDPEGSSAPRHVEDFKKAVELFTNITTGSHRLSILGIGGPLVALLSLFVQKVLLPYTPTLWTAATGRPVPHSLADLQGTESFFMVFGAIALWMLVSAWMDMRHVVQEYEIAGLERDAFASAGLKKIPEIPFDLIFCIALSAAALVAYPVFLDRLSGPTGSSGALERNDLTPFGITFAAIGALVLTAFVRRHVLSKARMQP
jgi:hypothetical protein